MDIRLLRNFLRLADTLNYRRASEAGFVAQPALSRQIQQLEEEVGARLFDRTKRSVALTPAGQYFRGETERIVAQLTFAVRHTAQIHRGEAGEVRIGHASSSMQSVLPGLLVRLRQQTPGLLIHLDEITNRQQLEALHSRTIDIGFAPNVSVPPTLGSQVVYEEDFVLLLPADHRITTDTFTDLGQLADEPFILPPRSEGRGYVETIDALCQHHGFTPRIAYESANSSTVLRLVEAGMGISLEPASTLRGQHLRIQAIDLTNVPLRARTLLIWLRDRETELAPLLRLFQTLL